MKKSIAGDKSVLKQADCLSQLPNIGKVLEEHLHDAGIHTSARLREIGSKEAFILVRLKDSGACLHMLYALEGAVQGMRYTQLSEDTRQDLKQFFNSL